MAKFTGTYMLVNGQLSWTPLHLFMLFIEMLLHIWNCRLCHPHSPCICFLKFLSFSGWHYMLFSLWFGTCLLFFPFHKNFSANLALKIFLLSLRVVIFNNWSASWYECFLFSIRFTATFWTLSGRLVSLCWFVISTMTENRCSRTRHLCQSEEKSRHDYEADSEQ